MKKKKVVYSHLNELKKLKPLPEDKEDEFLNLLSRNVIMKDDDGSLSSISFTAKAYGYKLNARQVQKLNQIKSNILK